MKIKKSQLKQLIKEELEATMDEGFLDKLMGRTDLIKTGINHTFRKSPIVELTPRGKEPIQGACEIVCTLRVATLQQAESERMKVSVDVSDAESSHGPINMDQGKSVG